MPKSILEEKCRAALSERIMKLSPDSPAKWGSLTVGGMLCHIGDGMEQSLGRREDIDRSTFLFRTVVKFLVLHVLPMPKGAPTSPRLDPNREGTHPQEFERDRNRALALLEESAIWPKDRPMAPHPAFGPMTRAQRGILTWKHIHHHLKQFEA